MTNQEMIAKAGDVMKMAAQAFVDRGMKVYTVEMHAACAGKAIEAVQSVKPEGGKLTATEIAALFHALYNHSAWRQKWEKAGLFQPIAKRASSLDTLMAELDEEGV